MIIVRGCRHRMNMDDCQECSALNAAKAEAVLAFAAWLTIRHEQLVISRTDECGPIAQAVEEYRLAQGWPRAGKE